MKFKHLIIFAALLTAFQTSFASNGQKSNWEIGVYGGFVFPDNYAPLGNLENGWLAGGRIGYSLNKHFSLETSYQHALTDTAAHLNATFDSVRLNGLFSFLPYSKIRPFVTIGGGAEMVKMPGVNETDAAPNFGLGAKWYMSDHAGLRLDGRYIPVNVGGPIQAWQNNLETFASFFLTFGCSCQKSAPVENPPVAEKPEVPAATTEPAAQPAPVAPVAEAPAPVPTPEPVKVEKVRGVLKGVHFKTASATLTEDSKKILDEVAVTLSEFPDVKVEVAGHTDNSGSAQTNLSLSQKRAETVLKYLVSKGVAGERLSAKGYGSEKPLTDNQTIEGKKTNRRVELNW